MRAVRYSAFRVAPELVTLPDPTPPPDGVVIQVAATGLCRSDWHGWMGHDPDIQVPHVPGHEFAGTIVAVGKDVRRWKQGARVTTPFSMGCGNCEPCRNGDLQICDNYYQPGFTGPGSFAEFVALPYADLNLVALPESLSFVNAAVLGCRFATAYRAITGQGRTKPGEWVAVHCCGGVGLSAVMIAHAVGARVVAIDINADALKLATELGAEATILATGDVPAAVHELTGGGAHVSVEALGSPTTTVNSIRSLRKRGRHVQVGLLLGDDSNPPIPMSPVIARELEILGSHGVPAPHYAGMMELIQQGKVEPERLLGRTVSLEEGAQLLTKMGEFGSKGVTVLEL